VVKKGLSTKQSPASSSPHPFSKEAVRANATKYYSDALRWLINSFPSKRLSTDLEVWKIVAQGIALDHSYNDRVRAFPVSLKRIIVEQNNISQETARHIAYWSMGLNDPWLDKWKKAHAPRLFGHILDSTSFLNNSSMKEHCKKDSSLQGIYNALKTWPRQQAFFSVFDRWDGHKIYSDRNIQYEVRRYTSEELKRINAGSEKTKLPPSTAQAILKLGLHKDQTLVTREW